METRKILFAGFRAADIPENDGEIERIGEENRERTDEKYSENSGINDGEWQVFMIYCVLREL